VSAAVRPEIPGADVGEVAVEGVRFRVLRSAPARKRRTTPVLLLHGVPETANTWRRLMPELAKDRVVIAPDLKGLGETEVREPYDVPSLVAELAALVLHEVDGPVDVVGHDWGGALAIALAGARPELVRRLVDISGPYRKLNLLTAFHVPLFALPGLPEAAFALAGEQLVQGMFRFAWKGPTPLEPDVLEHYVAAYTSPDRVGAMLGYYRAATRPRVAKLVTSLIGGGSAPAVPSTKVQVERALVVWGADDPSVRLPDGESVVQDLGSAASMLTVPGVGHWPHEEAPDVVVPAVAEFLRAP
jgi:haloacetate dehalogenase